MQQKQDNNPRQALSVNIESYEGKDPVKIIYSEQDPSQPQPVEARQPEAFDIRGIISAPADWLEKRVGDFDHHNARVEVHREEGKILLVVNERNCSPALDWAGESLRPFSYNDTITKRILRRSTVTGAIQFTNTFLRMHINDEEAWIDPQKLAAFFRLNRSIFADQEQGMVIVSTLKNLKARINAEYEKTKDTYTGSRTEFFQQNVEHNLPKGFDIVLPIFKGAKAEKYNVEFDVDIVDGKILLQLKSPAINDEVETARDIIIDAELKRIREAAPELVIIEM